MLTVEDLEPFATIEPLKAQAMIDDALAMAGNVAPCLTSAEVQFTPGQLGTIRAILRRAILRWHDVGTGMVSQASSGPFQQSVDTTRAAPKGLFWPSEITDLQAVCRAAQPTEDTAAKVFTVNTGAHRRTAAHSVWCDLMLGGTVCSCGSYLNNYQGPIPDYGEML